MLCVILKPNKTQKMKIYLQLILLTITYLFFSCKENSTKQKIIKTEKQVEIKKSKELLQDSVVKEKKKELPKHYEHKYVIAKSGLNYRDSPNGNILGKFPLNTSLKIIEYTKITDEIKDGEKTIKGEWVGVEKFIDNVIVDTVYVFNGFLSYSYVQSDLKLYYASSYYQENNGNSRTAFLNLSETYFQNTYNENSDRTKNFILTENDLKKDTIRLNQNQRRKLINKLKISESDKVFIYLIKNDSVINFDIKDLPAIACMNIYGPSDDYQNQEYDYEFGFDLGKKITDWYNLAYIGRENPFQTENLKPIIWTKIENDRFPTNKDLKKSEIILSSYMFSTERYDYFLQKASERAGSYHLRIIDKDSKSEIFNRHYYDSEGTSLTGLNIKGNENKEIEQSQWAGKLFKDKATIVFDFLNYSFGCPSITVLDETEPTIPILCDNRH